MKNLAKSLPNLTAPRLQSFDPPKLEVTLNQSPEAKQNLAKLLLTCFQTLKLYGKEPESLEAANSLFQLVLADYTQQEIVSAMAFYLKTNTEMPTPADIANIIERGNKPPFDKSVYVSISKKSPEDRDGDEWKYMREFEQFMINGKH